MLELDPPLRIRPALEHLIQNTEVACLDGALPGGDAVALAPETEHLGGELLAPLANPVPHVLPRHPEENSLLAFAADHHVDMGMRGIEVLDGHPLKAQAQVAFHRRHELARVLPEVQSFAGFGRDDELPERGSSARCHPPRRSGMWISCSWASKPRPGFPSCWAPSRARYRPWTRQPDPPRFCT